jgi:hypothetical protein
MHERAYRDPLDSQRGCRSSRRGGRASPREVQSSDPLALSRLEHHAHALLRQALHGARVAQPAQHHLVRLARGPRHLPRRRALRSASRGLGDAQQRRSAYRRRSCSRAALSTAQPGLSDPGQAPALHAFQQERSGLGQRLVTAGSCTCSEGSTSQSGRHLKAAKAASCNRSTVCQPAGAPERSQTAACPAWTAQTGAPQRQGGRPLCRRPATAAAARARASAAGTGPHSPPAQACSRLQLPKVSFFSATVGMTQDPVLTGRSRD